jgi:hypothetical protein
MDAEWFERGVFPISCAVLRVFFMRVFLLCVCVCVCVCDAPTSLALSVSLSLSLSLCLSPALACASLFAWSERVSASTHPPRFELPTHNTSRM